MATATERRFGTKPRGVTDPAEYGRQYRKYRSERRWLRVRRCLISERERGWVLPKDEREWTWCAAVVRNILARPRAVKYGKSEIVSRIVERAAREAVKEAGYPEKRERTIAQRAEEMLAVPRLQRGIMAVFAKAGLSLDLAGRTLADTMKHAPEHADRLKAVEIFLRATTGFAPTKGSHAVAVTHVDGFFSEEEFAKTPPIDVTP